MKPFRSVFTLGLLFFAASLEAATMPAVRTENLGGGLTYVRPTSDNATSLALLKPVPSGTAILDLRYFSSGEHTAAWIATLKTFATFNRLCLVLVSPETSPSLVEDLATKLPSCITIGRTSPSLNVRIPVDTPASSDRGAYDAIVKGTALAKLLPAAIEKTRYDEAALTKEHAADLTGSDTTAEDTPALAEKPKNEKKTSAPTDLVLERAVQIQRGLLALRKI